jgi:hypothetical protein
MTRSDDSLALTAARTEVVEQALVSALSGITARDLMTAAPLVWPSSMTVLEFSRSELPRVSWSSFPTFDDSGEIDGLVVIDRSLDLTRLAAAGLHLRDIAIPRARVAVARRSTSALELLWMPRSTCAGRILVFGTSSSPAVSDPLVGIIAPCDLDIGLRHVELCSR